MTKNKEKTFIAASGVFHIYPPDFADLEDNLYWLWVREDVLVFTPETNPSTVVKFTDLKIRGLRIENVQEGLSSKELHRFIKQKYSDMRRVKSTQICAKNLNVLQARNLIFSARSTQDSFEKRHERFSNSLPNSAIGMNLNNVIVGHNNTITQHFGSTGLSEGSVEDRIASVEENLTLVRDGVTKLMQADILKRLAKLERTNLQLNEQFYTVPQKLEGYGNSYQKIGKEVFMGKNQTIGEHSNWVEEELRRFLQNQQLSLEKIYLWEGKFATRQEIFKLFLAQSKKESKKACLDEKQAFLLENEVGYGVYSRNKIVVVLPNHADISLVSSLLGLGSTQN